MMVKYFVIFVICLYCVVSREKSGMFSLDWEFGYVNVLIRLMDKNGFGVKNFVFSVFGFLWVWEVMWYIVKCVVSGWYGEFGFFFGVLFYWL